MWRRQDGQSQIVDVQPGTSITIPVDTAFQISRDSDEPLIAVGMTMPPWPGSGEAQFVDDCPWRPTVEAGPA
jgi:mannose-6-phosphate isomerase-like protein (cupin superfamily)